MILRIPVGNMSFAVSALGPDDAEHAELDSWSLRVLQSADDARGKGHSLARAIGEHLQGMGVNAAYAPSVACMSANVTSPELLTEAICIHDKTTLYRNNSVKADGVHLVRQHDAFLMSAAGCPVIIAVGNGHCIVAHASRDSLVERSAVMGAPKRPHLSIVHAIIAELRGLRVSPRDIGMTMLFAIPADVFEHDIYHPQYGDYNRRLAKFIEDRWEGGIVRKNGRVFLDLEQVFVEQALQAGILCVWAEHSLAECPHLAHTRDECGPNRRNLIVVRRDG